MFDRLRAESLSLNDQTDNLLIQMRSPLGKRRHGPYPSRRILLAAVDCFPMRKLLYLTFSMALIAA
jgi:hypothetical protein